MKHITCPSCGMHNLTETDKFCPQCQFPLAVPEMPENIAPRQSTGEDIAESEPEKEIVTGRGIYLPAGIICLAAALLLIAAGAVWTYVSVSDGFNGGLFASLPILAAGICLGVSAALFARSRITVTNKRVLIKRFPMKSVSLSFGDIREIRTLGMRTVFISDKRGIRLLSGVSNYNAIADAIFDQGEDR